MQREILVTLAIVILAIIPSVYATQKTSFDDLMLCSDMLGKDQGSCYLEKKGYPVSHTVSLVATPVNNDDSKPDYAGYQNAEYELGQFNVLNVVISIVFWSSLLAVVLYIITRSLEKITKTKNTKKAKK